MSSKPKNAQLPPLEGPARSAVVKKSKSDILGHASEIIRAQSQKLKRELDHEIDRQLSVKIKAQEKAITSLKNGIQTLRSENDQVKKTSSGLRGQSVQDDQPRGALIFSQDQFSVDINAIFSFMIKPMVN